MSVPGVSVIIPVYNAGRNLRPCLDSLVEQDISTSLLEIVAVDDGSTDGSGKLLDEYAAEYPHLRVIHQENSGWPGRPRNVGIEASRKELVFFMDADDYVGPEAFRRLHEFATRHGSDVAVPKLVGVGGRWMHKRPWARTQVDADLELAFRTLSPQKLFRRTFLRQWNLRFPEEKMRLEDGMMVARAYLTASRVSLVADYDYYFIRSRDDGENISYQHAEAQGYCASLRTIIDTVRELCPDRELAELLALDLYRRKALKPFTPQRFPRWPETRRREWVAAVRELAASHIPAELERRLTFPFNMRSYLARTGDLDALVDVTTRQRQGKLSGRMVDGRVFVDIDTIEGVTTFDASEGVQLHAETERVGRGVGHVLIRGRVRLDVDIDIDELPLAFVMREQASGAERVLHPRSRGRTGDGGLGFEVAVPGSAFPSHPPSEDEVWGLHLRAALAGTHHECRLAASGKSRHAQRLPESLPVRHSRFEARPYVTRYGNLSIRVDAATVPPGQRRVDSARLALGAARRRIVARARHQ